MTIKEARKNLGYSQTKTAVLCRVSLSAYILWERGACRPTPENLLMLNKTLKQDNFDDLLGIKTNVR